MGRLRMAASCNVIMPAVEKFIRGDGTLIHLSNLRCDSSPPCCVRSRRAMAAMGGGFVRMSDTQVSRTCVSQRLLCIPWMAVIAVVVAGLVIIFAYCRSCRGCQHASPARLFAWGVSRCKRAVHRFIVFLVASLCNRCCMVPFCHAARECPRVSDAKDQCCACVVGMPRARCASQFMASGFVVCEPPSLLVSLSLSLSRSSLPQSMWHAIACVQVG